MSIASSLELLCGARACATSWVSEAASHRAKEYVVVITDLVVYDGLRILAQVRVCVAFPTNEFEAGPEETTPDIVDLLNNSKNRRALFRELSWGGHEHAHYANTSRHSEPPNGHASAEALAPSAGCRC